MGQTSSSSSTPSSPGTTSRRGEEPGWVDFVGFWLGSLTPLGQQHLPASWEELLTWTDALNSWQLRPLQTTIPELLKGKTVVLSSHDGAAKEAAIEFHPTVDANFTDDVARLPCFSWLDRAIFYHQHVRTRCKVDTSLRRLSALCILASHILDWPFFPGTHPSHGTVTARKRCRVCRSTPHCIVHGGRAGSTVRSWSPCCGTRGNASQLHTNKSTKRGLYPVRHLLHRTRKCATPLWTWFVRNL